jgi:hypothetical protein
LQKPLCPKCGEPVGLGGNNRGKQRYMHANQQRKTCRWQGTRPVGVEKFEAAGVDQKTAKKLARQVAKTGAKRLVITSAQNATPVNKAFFAALLGYCKARGAQLIVIPYRYKNATSMWNANNENDDWWAPELVPFLMDQRVDLNPNLVLLADIKTQPTASGPLQGFETVTGSKSAIIGHPKLALKTVPTPQSKMAKILTTTGSVTEKNYIPSKAGKKAEHHHTFGAAVVELDGRRFHLRQINAVRDGSFCDLNFEYSGAKVREQRVEALVMGDTHMEFADPVVLAATFDGKSSIVATLKPKTLVWHDLWDGYARNHHHRGEVFINYVKHHTPGRGNVRTTLEETFALVDRVTPKGVENIFVPSNHPDALGRWVKETDPRLDPENCVFWAETFKMMAEGSRWSETGARTPDPFAYWGVKMLKTAKRARFPGRGDGVTICNIDVNHHGDAGPNGSRGSLKGYTRIGVKSIIGHSHSPGIEEGAYQVGHNSYGNLEYQRGPSSWLPADCIIYGNGKRSLLFIIDGAWRA